MKRRIVAAVSALVLVSGLGMAGCSSEKPADPKAKNTTVVDGKNTNPTVTGEYGKEPKVSAGKGTPPAQLQVQLLHTSGKGKVVAAGDTVTVNYHGTLWADGSVFDSSFTRGEPATFGLDQVIKGWTEGIPGYRVGDRLLMVIPPDKGYGDAGSPPKIPAKATLVFVVDIIETLPAAEAAKAAEADQKTQQEQAKKDLAAAQVLLAKQVPVKPAPKLPVSITGEPGGEPRLIPVKGAKITGDKVQVLQIAEGTGEVMKDKQVVKILAVMQPFDGQPAQSLWSMGPQPVPLATTTEIAPFIGHKVGSRWAVIVPAAASDGQLPSGAVFVYDVVGLQK